MLSPFDLAENYTLIFAIAEGALIADELGNMQPTVSSVTVKAFLKQSNRVSSPPTVRPSEIEQTAWYVEGYATAPMRLPNSVEVNSWATVTTSTGETLYFFLEAPINPPYGRGGIGDLLEEVAGTKLKGWLQLKKATGVER